MKTYGDLPIGAKLKDSDGNVIAVCLSHQDDMTTVDATLLGVLPLGEISGYSSTPLPKGVEVDLSDVEVPSEKAALRDLVGRTFNETATDYDYLVTGANDENVLLGGIKVVDGDTLQRDYTIYP